MKKTLLTLAFVSAGLLGGTAAMAQNAPHNDGWFINGNVGRVAVDKGPYNDHDTGYALSGGYRWAINPSVALGVEAGYNTLGNMDVRKAYTDGNPANDDRSSLHGWTAGVNGHFNLTPNWYVSAHTGLYRWSGDGLTKDANPVRKSTNDTSWYAGAGVGYDFSNNFSLGVNYDYYDASKKHLDLNSDMVSVNVEYRF